MKFTTFACSAALLVASSAAVVAQGASERTPGDKMQDRGSVKGCRGHRVMPRDMSCRRRVRSLALRGPQAMRLAKRPVLLPRPKQGKTKAFATTGLRKQPSLSLYLGTSTK